MRCKADTGHLGTPRDAQGGGNRSDLRYRLDAQVSSTASLGFIIIDPATGTRRAGFVQACPGDHNPIHLVQLAAVIHGLVNFRQMFVNRHAIWFVNNTLSLAMLVRGRSGKEPIDNLWLFKHFAF
mmetsp:Transcript_64405/g.208975  ORF Transcript_64405/g.208975 Transcript_64405/m.208975 type:complete len:125 (+) Transcript_64405:1797-2171(+)